MKAQQENFDNIEERKEILVSLFPGLENIPKTEKTDFCLNLVKLAPELQRRNFEDLSVLDIGCGCSFPERYEKDSSYVPTISRILKSSGMDVTGIDIRPGLDEPYRHVSMDLTRERMDERINGGFDIVLALRLFDSMILDDALASKKGPSFRRNYEEYMFDFFKSISEQSYSLLNKDGFYLVEPLLSIEKEGDYANSQRSRNVLGSIGFNLDSLVKDENGTEVKCHPENQTVLARKCYLG